MIKLKINLKNPNFLIFILDKFILKLNLAKIKSILVKRREEAKEESRRRRESFWKFY